jgi:Flp pilus assembly pilin Flp
MRRKRRGWSFRSLWSDDHGATAVEYAIMAGCIAAVIVGAVGVLGGGVLGLFDSVVATYPSS